jgi:hypothetical protein
MLAHATKEPARPSAKNGPGGVAGVASGITPDGPLALALAFDSEPGVGQAPALSVVQRQATGRAPPRGGRRGAVPPSIPGARFRAGRGAWPDRGAGSRPSGLVATAGRRAVELKPPEP